MNEDDTRSAVLVTAIGTATSTAIITELKASGEYLVVGTDINDKNEIATSKDVDRFVKAPSVVDDEDAFLEFVLGVCEENSIEYYFAVIDEEIAMLSANRKVFEERGIRLCIPNRKAIEVSHDKRRFSEWIGENFPSIAIRSYDRIDDIERSDLPLFLKPTIGRASIGCSRIDSLEQLAGLREGRSCEADSIVQDFVDGEVITVDVMRNAATGQFKAIPRRELLRNANGCGIAVELFRDEFLVGLCDSIAERLDLDGVVNMEFFDTPCGYRIIEINPRFSAGSAFTMMAGENLVDDAIAIADGRSCEDYEVDCSGHYAKRYEAYRLD